MGTDTMGVGGNRKLMDHFLEHQTQSTIMPKTAGLSLRSLSQATHQVQCAVAIEGCNVAATAHHLAGDGETRQ
jgi:hypothetical protein